MSQIEQNLASYLVAHPEIERCIDIINRRSLARRLIKEKAAHANQMEAVIATLRRYPFKKTAKDKALGDIRIRIKDRIVILDLEKSKELVKDLREVIDKADYDKGETLKIVVGSSSVKIFIDESALPNIASIQKKHKAKKAYKGISEFSLLFSPSAHDRKGVVSWVTGELALNDINICEMLTATPELLIYMEDKDAVKGYEVLRRMCGD